jgi:G:T-mismatch repair DNA endonuclease (very short patch repair protein)
MQRRFKSVLQRLEVIIGGDNTAEDAFADKAWSSSKSAYKRRTRLGNVGEELDEYLRQIPVVGFNSQKYDINVMKGPLMRLLLERSDGDFGFVVKQQNSMKCVTCSFAKFLDIINFIAPGYSYAKYLKAYKCEQAKGFFPYEWMKRLEQLDCTELPHKDSFYSSLKQEHISDADYRVCQDAWQREGMTTFRDFVIWYNNLDVEPFVEAIHKQRIVYRQKGIDLLKDAISLPGLAVRWMFHEAPQPTSLGSNGGLGALSSTLKKTQPICLIDKQNKDMYKLIKDNLVGGPSVIFHRYHRRGKTRIRSRRYGKKAKKTAVVVGLDVAALYLFCIGQYMPTGYPIRRRAKDSFAPSRVLKHSKVAQGWLEYVSWKEGIAIRHALKGGEARLGRHNLPVDGFCVASKTVYQFHGCFWHGHPCSKTLGVEIHPTKGKAMSEIYADTLEKDRYIRELGFTLRTVWECEWEDEVDSTPAIKAFLRIFFRTMYPPARLVTNEAAAIESIRNGKFFGFVECDISVPEELKDKFSEMSPIFKNVDVSREHLSSHMREFAEAEGFLARPQRMLVGSLRGDKILLLSELARWYLEHGLVITKIYQLIDYMPRKAFAPFVDSVSAARRLGDADPDQEMLASTSKLVGNSAYGKTITNKERHRQVKYVDGDEEASARIRGNRFVSLEEIDDLFYEMVMHKSKVSFVSCALLDQSTKNVRIFCAHL